MRQIRAWRAAIAYAARFLSFQDDVILRMMRDAFITPGRIADRPGKPCAFAQRAKSMANTKKKPDPEGSGFETVRNQPLVDFIFTCLETAG